MTLKLKVTGLAVLATFLPVVVMTALTHVEQGRIDHTVTDELRGMIRESTGQIARDVYALCDSANSLLHQRVEGNLRLAHKFFTDKGGMRVLEGKTSWRAVNQLKPEEVLDIKLDRVEIAGQIVEGNLAAESPGGRAPLVDEVADLVGGTCTVFQRMNAAGDMLRIVTNVRDSQGRRAVGTYISRESPVVQAVLSGSSWLGPAFVVNALYATAYQPITDPKGEVIGMLYTGLKLDAVDALRQAIQEIKVGKTGYVAVLGGTGEKKGHYIVAPKGATEEEARRNLLSLKSNGGEPFVANMIDKALRAQGKGVTYEEYEFQRQGEPRPRAKLAAMLYFAPWDWVIVPGTYIDDYDDGRRRVEDALQSLMKTAGMAGVAILLVMVGAAYILGGRIAGPIAEATALAQIIAGGDLLSAHRRLEEMGKEDDQSAEETSRLRRAIRAMVEGLSSLVAQVQRSGIQIMTSSTEIAASARELEATTAEQAASTNEVVATAKEISATSQDLAQTMQELAAGAAETGELAAKGMQDLTAMEPAMRRLSQSTASISSRLSAIHEKASNIGSVVTTINKVADQTNLLSLNAAIEAEKAGEYGQGFAVVAREIRRLADQTAVATLDIEEMVKEMQSAVATGVMEMDRFNEEVRRGVSEVGAIASQQGKVIERVQTLTPQFEHVNEGMRLQSEGAKQITESMVQLSQTASQTAESLKEFANVTRQLNEASRALQDEVSRFKVSA